MKSWFWVNRYWLLSGVYSAIEDSTYPEKGVELISLFLFLKVLSSYFYDVKLSFYKLLDDVYILFFSCFFIFN